MSHRDEGESLGEFRALAWWWLRFMSHAAMRRDFHDARVQGLVSEYMERFL